MPGNRTRGTECTPIASNFSKLDKFEGVDFRRWQKKMHFLLSSMTVVYVLTTLIHEDDENAIVEQIRKRAKRANDFYVCRGLILNGNKKYFVIFIDDASRFYYVYELHTKDEALDKFKVFKTEVELQQGSLIKIFKTDKGGCKRLGCKWISKIKLKVNGTIEKFKARLVQGFRQKLRIDYFDIYAPVENEVYMNQPRVFIMLGNENKEFKLIKSLYGLKRAPKQCKFDKTGKGVIICLCVDDILIFGTEVDLTKEFLSSKFSMMDIGEADVILEFVMYQQNLAEQLTNGLARDLVLMSVEGMLASHGIDLISMMHKKIGNGLNTSFWEDRWRGKQRLKEAFPRIYALEVNKHISVAFKFEQTSLSSSLRRMPRSGIESEQWDHLLDSLEGVMVDPSEDRWSWDLNGSGEFSVASARRYIDNNRLPDISSKTRWIKEVPIKVNVHAWKVRINGLPTQ
nr:RNA-directed DNA polymerase, eukaryota, reverse transcriptase zinc-binding domain protein [Tanacetum cinerariifolium]